MAVDGIYLVHINTPLGPQAITAVLKSQGTTLSGSVSGMNRTVPIQNGTTQGNHFSFSGSIDTMLGRISAEIDGTADGKTIQASAKTKLGTIPVAGKAV